MAGSIQKELNIDRFVDSFRANEQKIVSLMRRLVQLESPSGDEEGSKSVVNVIADAANELGFASLVERIAAPGYGEHLRIRAFEESSRREQSLLILGHTDTVYPRGTLSERPWREEQGRLYGPGIFDMKASCALALWALLACHSAGRLPAREVVLLFTCDEEAGSHSGRPLVEAEARRAAAVLVLEPPASRGRVKTSRKGTGNFALSVQGIASHAGLEPEKGASAILEIARQVERLHSLNQPELGTTVTVGTIRGGTRPNVVPAEARAEIDVRFTTLDEARRIEQIILNLGTFDARTRLTISGGVNRPPMERTAGVERLFLHARQLAALIGFELGEAGVGGASDGNFAAACGAAVLDGLGVEGDGAHAVHEHILKESIVPRGALLAALIATL